MATPMKGEILVRVICVISLLFPGPSGHYTGRIELCRPLFVPVIAQLPVIMCIRQEIELPSVQVWRAVHTQFSRQGPLC